MLASNVWLAHQAAVQPVTIRPSLRLRADCLSIDDALLGGLEHERHALTCLSGDSAVTGDVSHHSRSHRHLARDPLEYDVHSLSICRDCSTLLRPRVGLSLDSYLLLAPVSEIYSDHYRFKRHIERS